MTAMRDDFDVRAAVLDAIGAPAVVIDEDYRYLAFNRAQADAMRRLYDVEIEVGMDVLETISSEPAREAVRTQIDRALAGETVHARSWLGTNSERRFYDVTYAPLERDGRVFGVAAVAMDETELEEAQEALRLSEERFAAAFRMSPDAININRLSDGLFLDINDGFTSLTGYARDDVTGKTSAEIAIWEDAEDRARLVTGLRERGHVEGLVARFRRKNGSVGIGEMSAAVLSVRGEPCILSVTRDVTERELDSEALQKSNERLERLTHDVVETLGRVVETRDPYTQGHERRVAALCRAIATRLGLAPDQVDTLETVALVHDVGKLGVPAEILTKPGKLSSSEYDLVREHPKRTFEILSGIAFDQPIAEIAAQHHERLDGSGYPQGLHGDEIGLPGRILAVADVAEAMASHRPYRPSLGMEAARDELLSGCPEKYDERVVRALLDLWSEGGVDL